MEKVLFAGQIKGIEHKTSKAGAPWAIVIGSYEIATEKQSFEFTRRIYVLSERTLNEVNKARVGQSLFVEGRLEVEAFLNDKNEAKASVKLVADRIDLF